MNRPLGISVSTTSAGKDPMPISLPPSPIPMVVQRPLPVQIVKKKMQRSGLTGHIPSMFTMGFTIGRRRDALDSNEVSDRSISTFKRFPQTVYRSLVRCRHLEVNLFRNGFDDGPYRLCAGSVGDNRNR
jgi:hypothetical protein